MFCKEIVNLTIFIDLFISMIYEHGNILIGPIQNLHLSIQNMYKVPRYMYS